MATSEWQLSGNDPAVSFEVSRANLSSGTLSHRLPEQLSGALEIHSIRWQS